MWTMTSAELAYTIGSFHFCISFYGKAKTIPNRQVVPCGDSGMLKSLSTQSNERNWEKCVCRWLSTTITCFNVFKINSAVGQNLPKTDHGLFPLRELFDIFLKVPSINNIHIMYWFYLISISTFSTVWNHKCGTHFSVNFALYLIN